MQVYLPIKSTTGYYYSIGTHSTSLWLAFLANIQQRRALEHGFIVLNSTSTHCHAYQKYTGSLQKTDASIFQTYSGGFGGIHISEVPVYYYLLYWSTKDDSRYRWILLSISEEVCNKWLLAVDEVVVMHLAALLVTTSFLDKTLYYVCIFLYASHKIASMPHAMLLWTFALSSTYWFRWF